MSNLLILISLCLVVACSTEKPSDVAGRTSSEKSVSGTQQTPADSGSKEINSSEATRSSTSIKNTPPELSRVKIMPEVFKAGDKLYIDAEGSDIDGDDVSIVYEWTVNGEPAGNGRQVDGELKRGDGISVKITPFDGKIYGRSIILNREIRNMPPMLAEDKAFVFDGKTYAYQIKAADPDGDALTYSLKTAPDGMTIDSSGLIRWNVTPDFKGEAPVTVSVSDGSGGEALMSFTVKIGLAEKMR